ncbi:MAG: LptF/LptG family permease [SAR324 cluster bacterium]|nr:LptF/LptG family permease [SAR324 cluster bacterium]MCZ6533047.1 LptF/LptG family permease [SAR324 cluster bacterium]MCZ6557335.1 LptF/LptG family permease [SAR324 cluster bacterium]MCZ6842204.1 LptF/LptG family permease [SAR324 cluster bacterium]
MKILSWYVAIEFLRNLLLCLLAMLLLLLIANMFGDIESAFNSWPGFLRFIDNAAGSVPTIVEIVLPMSVLLGTVITFTKFSRSSELVAMKIAGLGLRRITLPILLVLLPVAALGYLNQNYLYNALNRQEDHAARGIAANQWRSDGESIYYLKSINSQTNTLGSGYIFRWLAHPFRISELVTFSHGMKGAPDWRFRDVTKRRHASGSWSYSRVGNMVVPEQDFPNVFRPSKLDAHHMPILDLYRNIRQLEKRNPHIVVYRLEWYQKIAVLFVPFIMVLVGAPLAQSHARKAGVAGEIVITIFGGIVYWIGNEIFLTLGRGGILHPLISAWGINFLFFLLGLTLLLRAR